MKNYLIWKKYKRKLTSLTNMITIFLEDGKSLESQKNIPKVKYSYSVNNKWSNGSIHIYIYINLIKTKKFIYMFDWKLITKGERCLAHEKLSWNHK